MAERPKTISKISKMRRVHVAHPGTQRGFRVARILSERGRLGFFCTTIAFRPETFLAKKFPARALHGIPAIKVRQWDQWREWVSVVGARLPGYSLWKDAWWLARNRAFGRHVGREVGTRSDVLYGFDTSSAEMFIRGKRRGLKCVLDQSIVHTAAAERILREIARDRPQYAGSLAWKPYPESELDRRSVEVQLADMIIAPSRHVRDSVIEAGCAPVRTRVLPFGIDLDVFKPERRAPPSPLRVLFAGTMSQRKGIGYLFEAWKAAGLKDAELLIAGDSPGSFDWNPYLSEGVRMLGRVSRREMIDLYQTCHCFAFPTMMEGQANVILEAMASGCCVITTAASGIDDRIRNGENGLLLQPKNIEAWTETLRRLAGDRAEVERLGAAAAASSSDFSLRLYADRLLDALKEFLEK